MKNTELKVSPYNKGKVLQFFWYGNVVKRDAVSDALKKLVAASANNITKKDLSAVKNASPYPLDRFNKKNTPYKSSTRIR